MRDVLRCPSTGYRFNGYILSYEDFDAENDRIIGLILFLTRMVTTCMILYMWALLFIERYLWVYGNTLQKQQAAKITRGFFRFGAKIRQKTGRGDCISFKRIRGRRILTRYLGNPTNSCPLVIWELEGAFFSRYRSSFTNILSY